jgi:Glycosyltransferases, probably involved in cell wall biogenesis
MVYTASDMKPDYAYIINRILTDTVETASGGVSAVVRAIDIFTIAIMAIFTLCYLYQFIFMPIAWLCKRDVPEAAHKNRFAILICGRNEEKVISNCIDSLLSQNYPKELIRVFVCADNCTDRTAEIAKTAGATVYERHNTELIGKGYALTYLFEQIDRDYSDAFDGFIIFDADNIVDSMFVSSMNDMLEAGYIASTCYRNTKNYDANLVASCMGLWFLHDSRYLNWPRYIMKTGAAVSGTGFMVSKRYLDRIGGWHFDLLIEDIQFTVDASLRGETIGYCDKAITYDEQPTKFKTSWNQRIRWTRGYLQILRRYGGRLIGKSLRGSFTCLDMFMSLSPIYIFCVVGQLVYAVGLILSFFSGRYDFLYVLRDIGFVLGGAYVLFFMLGLFTTLSERKRIRASRKSKILTLFAFPISMILFLPITSLALFIKPQWKHIDHDSTVNKDDLKA